MSAGAAPLRLASRKRPLWVLYSTTTSLNRKALGRVSLPSAFAPFRFHFRPSNFWGLLQKTAGLFHAVARLHTFPTPGCLWDGWGPAGHPAMEIAGQGPADRCPGGPLGKLSNYADAYVRIYVFVRLRMCAAGYIHTSGKGGRDRVGAGSPNIGRRPSWPVARGK